MYDLFTSATYLLASFVILAIAWEVFDWIKAEIIKIIKIVKSYKPKN